MLGVTTSLWGGPGPCLVASRSFGDCQLQGQLDCAWWTCVTLGKIWPCLVPPCHPRSGHAWWHHVTLGQAMPSGPVSSQLSSQSHGGDKATTAVPSLQTTTRWPKLWVAKALWWVARTMSGWTPSSVLRRTRVAKATPSSSTPSSARPTSVTVPSPSRDRVPKLSWPCPQRGRRDQGKGWVWVTLVLHTQRRGQLHVSPPLAIKQHRLPPPTVLCHQFGCRHPRDPLSDTLVTVSPPTPPVETASHQHTQKAWQRVQLVSFIAGEGDKAVAGQGGGVRPPRGRGRGQLCHPYHPPGLPAPLAWVL